MNRFLAMKVLMMVLKVKLSACDGAIVFKIAGHVSATLPLNHILFGNLKALFFFNFPLFFNSDALQAVVTALYSKILVILGLAFPMAEVISDNVPKGYYQLFYVYLFLGSLLYLLFIYFDLLRTRAR